MDASRKKFIGRNATLIVGDSGITIARSARYALQHGGERQTTLRYEDLGEMRHRQAASRPGYLQFTTKQGVEGVTPLSRVNKIHYDRSDAHQFRRAREIIATKLQNAPTSPTSALPNLLDDTSGSSRSSSTLPFRRRI